ncbi:MAG: hypothetical protein ABJL75_06920 [Nonlabens ulvanivorans]
MKKEGMALLAMMVLIGQRVAYAQFDDGDAADQIVDGVTTWVPVVRVITVVLAITVAIGALMQLRNENADRVKIFGGVVASMFVGGLIYWLLGFIE